MNVLQQNDIANFDQTANNAKLWFMRAEDLHTAAIVLREKATSLNSKPESESPVPFEALHYAGIIFQSVMLQGFAIEVLLKAYYIAQGKTVSENGEYSIPTIKHDAHNLPSIADGVGFNLLATEREILTRLSLVVSSYGRYPITKNWQQNPMTEDKQGVPHRSHWNNDDHKTAEAVIQRLQDEIAALSKSVAKVSPEIIEC